MKDHHLYSFVAGAILLGATAYGINAAEGPSRSLMSPVDYGEANKAIESQAHAANARCREQEGHARDLCRAEALGDERIARAGLEADYRGTVAAAAEARLARAKARYLVARAKCSDSRSNIQCMLSARAERARTIAAAKLASS
jgi:hypothetical protein